MRREYFCNCGETIEKYELWCVKCEDYYNGKYENQDMCKWYLVGYEEGKYKIKKWQKEEMKYIDKEKLEEMFQKGKLYIQQN